MNLQEGRTFDQASPAEVIDFLQARNLEIRSTPAERLHVFNDGRRLFLEMVNGRTWQYPVRKSLLFKLLRWHAFPLAQLRTLNIDTMTSILNDYLLSVRSGDVTLVVEDGEGLSIMSRRYNRLEDLAILRLCSNLGIEKISRTDFFTRFYSEVREKKKIAVGDECGFGLNILNSETGFRALSVWHYILRYICTNGAVVRLGGKADVKVHYGLPPGELEIWLAGRITAIERDRASAVDRLQRSVSQAWTPLTEDRTRRMRGLLARRTPRSWFEELAGSTSLYEGFNIITAEARSLPPERRFELEALAGDLIPPVT